MTNSSSASTSSPRPRDAGSQAAGAPSALQGGVTLRAVVVGALLCAALTAGEPFGGVWHAPGPWQTT